MFKLMCLRLSYELAFSCQGRSYCRTRGASSKESAECMLGHWCIHPVVRSGALLALPRLGVSARSHISWFQTLISLQEIHIRSWHCQIKSQVTAFACPLRQTYFEVNAKAMSEGVHDSAADIELSRQAACRSQRQRNSPSQELYTRRDFQASSLPLDLRSKDCDSDTGCATALRLRRRSSVWLSTSQPCSVAMPSCIGTMVRKWMQWTTTSAIGHC